MFQVNKIVFSWTFGDSICLQEAGSLSKSIFSSSEVHKKTLMMMHCMYIKWSLLLKRQSHEKVGEMRVQGDSLGPN
jgi:hypothetical protein